jgi:signal transduction histidine kinase
LVRKDENEVIKKLLRDREELISSLMIANKTAATGALSASLAHELNQPVAAISLNTEYMERQMKEGRLNPEAFKEVIQNIQQDNQRIANIVSTLRDIFRQDEIKTSHVDLDELIEQIKPIIAPRARDLNIQMSFDLRVSQLVPLNSNEISQVILNLVNNAVDALTTADIKPKEILIQTQVINQWVELKISDNGPGIPEPLRAGIFDLMKSYKKEGMGLGLWLCKHIIDRHQGRIEYQESPTGGAEFIVQLPLETLKA